MNLHGIAVRLPGETYSTFKEHSETLFQRKKSVCKLDEICTFIYSFP